MTTQIWMYHRVLPQLPTAFGRMGCYHLRGTAITPDEWAEDLRRLRPVVPLEAVVAALEAGAPAPEGYVFTFDDGYAEWHALVAPMLRAARATATFFITTCMNRAAPRPHAIDAYYWLLDHASTPVWGVKLPDGQACVGDLRSDAGKRALVTTSPIKRALVEGDPESQMAVVAAVERAVGVPLPREMAAELYMDEGQWRALAQEHTLGAHGVTHRPWTRLGKEELRAELVTGREALARATGARVEFAAYPDGAWDARVVTAVRAARYRAAVIVGGTASPDVLTLPREFRCGARNEG